MTRPLALALASLSHVAGATGFACLTLWLSHYAPDILPRAWPLWGAAIMVAASAALCSLSLAYDAARAFARDMGAPLNQEG